MAEETVNTAAQRERNNVKVVVMCLSFVVGMSAMCAASVPLYSLFCKVTGFNGTTQQVDQASSVILDQKVRVSFDANVAPGLPWEFKPMQKEVNPRIGESIEIKFVAENKSDKPTRGQAIFNVTPVEAGAYFNKIQCFCFNETELKPGERKEMPVVFYVDPEMTKAEETKDVGTLTLSYTFYPREEPKTVTTSDAGTEKTQKKL